VAAISSTFSQKQGVTSDVPSIEPNPCVPPTEPHACHLAGARGLICGVCEVAVVPGRGGNRAQRAVYDSVVSIGSPPTQPTDIWLKTTMQEQRK
jgi:hypothetical protein